MKDFGKRIYDIAALCVAILAAIGGTAYLAYDGHVLFAIANILLVAMASPYVVARAKELIEL